MYHLGLPGKRKSGSASRLSGNILSSAPASACQDSDEMRLQFAQQCAAQTSLRALHSSCCDHAIGSSAKCASTG